ncbi:hypothetical protein DFJ73DRAFT_940773 [Zopfochytrium polystomum]|nr:hypothetical protein DFJ73DRAFT_940773 [Zopfochytrium polystomum]
MKKADSTDGGSGVACKPLGHDLPCNADLTGPAFYRSLEIFIVGNVLLAVVGVHVLFLRVRLAGLKGESPLTSMFLSVLTSILAVLFCAGSLAYFYIKEPLLMFVFQGVAVTMVFVTITLFMHAFLNPMTLHAPALQIYIHILYFLPTPTLLHVATMTYLGAIEARLQKDSDPSPALAAQYSTAKSIGTASSLALFATAVAYIAAAWIAFGRALRDIVGPSLLSLRSARASTAAVRGGSDPPPPKPTTSSSPPPPLSPTSNPSHASSSTPLDPLDRVERELRVGTVRAVRSVLKWVLVGLVCGAAVLIATKAAVEAMPKGTVRAFAVWVAFNLSQ